jgi:hypothetical protein
MEKQSIKKLNKKTLLEIKYAEIFKQLNTTYTPLPDNTSLAQNSPFTIYPTIVTYSIYENPIIGNINIREL